jgi:hypothetical protein
MLFLSTRLLKDSKQFSVTVVSLTVLHGVRSPLALLKLSFQLSELKKAESQPKGLTHQTVGLR